MVCQIHVVQDSQQRTVHLAGGLSAEQVGELLRACADAKGRLQIDLTDLLSLDAAGFDALQRLIGSGAELVGVDQYLRHKIGPM